MSVRNRSITTAALLTFLATSTTAQTLIVDSANGTGTNFTDLPQAVNAAPTGAILHVRPGTYSAFGVSGKSLRIIGHRSANGQRPLIAPNALFRSISISNTAPGQAMTLSGFEFTGLSGGLASAGFSVTNCAGPVLIEDLTCSFTASYPFTMSITSSANVHLGRVSISVFLVTAGTPTNAPLVVSNSQVGIHDLSCTGYRTTASSTVATPGAVIMQGSRVWISRSNINGGASLTGQARGGAGLVVTGGSTVQFLGHPAAPCVIGGGGNGTGPGGPGLELSGTSVARGRGAALRGGFGTPSGAPAVVDATSTLDDQPSIAAASAELEGTVLPGATVNYTLRAQPGALTWLLLGTEAALVGSPALSVGALQLAPIAIVPTGVVAASGILRIPSQVPTAWPDNTVMLAQFLAAQSNGELQASNLFTATSRY